MSSWYPHVNKRAPYVSTFPPHERLTLWASAVLILWMQYFLKPTDAVLLLVLYIMLDTHQPSPPGSMAHVFPVRVQTKTQHDTYHKPLSLYFVFNGERWKNQYQLIYKCVLLSSYLELIYCHNGMGNKSKKSIEQAVKWLLDSSYCGQFHKVKSVKTTIKRGSEYYSWARQPTSFHNSNTELSGKNTWDEVE